jgi:hypothetical protein
MAVEGHMEEERVHGWCGPRRWARGWRGPRWWRRSAWHQHGGGPCGVEVNAEEERSVRRWCGGGQRGIEAHTEEERSVRR